MRGDTNTMDSSIPEELMRYGSEEDNELIDFEADER
jgi:hypothetical protein